MNNLKPNLLKCICFFCFVLIFCSCGPSHTGGSTAATASSTTNPTLTTSSTPTPVPAASAQTDCPPANTARAAFMPGMTLGTHPNIFYATEVNNQLAIDRYDVTTGQMTQVIALPPFPHPMGGGGILSNDGQWIIFHGAVGAQDAIQMVRVDGQDLQTLYCGWVSSFLLSPDQKTLAFYSPSYLKMLDMASGKLQTTYTAPQNSPGPWYIPIEWQTNTSLFVAKQLEGRGGSGPLLSYPNLEVDLVKDTTLDSNSQSTNFQQVFPGGGRGFDIYQNQILISDYTAKNAWMGPSKITIQILDGNASTIYTDPNNAILNAHFVSRTKIAFFVGNETVSTTDTGLSVNSTNVGIWTINTNGTELTQVATFPDNSSFQSSFMVSRDGSQYLIKVGTTASSGGNLFVGKLQGGTSAMLVTGTVAAGTLEPIGWSTF